jgi:hypothetical protein
MKKILLSLALACFAFTGSSNAQVIWTQNFEGVVMPALPAGWSLGHSTGSPAWFTSDTSGATWGALTGAINLPAHTIYLVVDDAVKPNQLHDTVMSPTFSVVGYPNAYLNYDYFFYGATNNMSKLTEYAYMLGSKDGGATWAAIDTLRGYASWVTGHASLATLTGANCKVAFTYTDNGGAIIGVAVDNVQEQNLTADSVGLNSIAYNSAVNGISINGQTLSFTVQNYGKPATINVYYTVDGGAPVSQTFPASGFIAPFTTQTFSFTTAIAGLVSGSNTIKVAISSVNSAADLRSDTVLTSSCVLASASGQRSGLVEEFTSSTCPPCASFASSFDPFCNTLNADNPTSFFNIIKYQMNWPDWNDDRSYNSDGLARRTYYNCNSIPEHLVNGIIDNYGWSYPFTTADNAYFTAEFAAASAYNAFMDLSINYSVDTISKKLYLVTKVTPHFTKTGAYHLHIIAADKHYQNIGNEWGMLDYYNVMRKMFPNGNGRAISSFTDGVAQTFYDTAIAYTSGDWVPASTVSADSANKYPHMNSNTFWNNPLLASEAIAFVQEDATKSIMQSIVAPVTDASTIAEHHVGISTLSQVGGLAIYPNPAKDQATLSFALGISGNVEINVMEYTSRVVSNVVNQSMIAGAQKVTIPTKNIVPGNYLVIIKTDAGTNAVRLTVEK